VRFRGAIRPLIECELEVEIDGIMLSFRGLGNY